MADGFPELLHSVSRVEMPVSRMATAHLFDPDASDGNDGEDDNNSDGNDTPDDGSDTNDNDADSSDH